MLLGVISTNNSTRIGRKRNDVQSLYFIERGLFVSRTFCPGACGLPFLGDFSFAAFTSSSRRFFGIERTARMTFLKCRNSGVESNGAAFILFR